MASEVTSLPAPAVAIALRRDKRRRRLAAINRLWLRVVLLCVLVVVWQVVATRLVSALTLPAPTLVFDALKHLWSDGELPSALGLTVRDWWLSVAISEVAGIIVGIVLGIYRWLDDLIGIYISFLVTAPVIIFVPLVTILVGFGETSRVIVAVLFALPAAVVNAATAVRTTDKALINAVRAFGGNRFQIIWHVVLPSSIPANLAAARNVTARALLGVLIAELTLAVGGIGGLLLQYGGRFETAEVFAGIAAVSVLAIASLLVIDGIQRSLPWNRR